MWFSARPVLSAAGRGLCARLSLYTLCFCLLPLAIFVEGAGADQVILENGDTLTGTIEKVVAGKLTLKTDYADRVQIDTSKIRTISTTNEVEVHLETGEVLKGRIETSEEGKFFVGGTGGESLPFDWKTLSVINPPPSRWTGSIALGGNIERGNTHRNRAAVDVDVSRKTSSGKFTIRYRFNYTHENDVVTKREHYGMIHYKYFLTKRLYAYVGSELESDTFRNLRLRVASGPGAGYQIWDDALKSLSFEGGVVYVTERRREGENDDFFSARLAGNFEWNPFSFLGLSETFIFYPRLGPLDNYILHNEATLRAPVGAGWALRLAHIFDYESHPPFNVGKVDTKWTLGMQYSF